MINIKISKNTFNETAPITFYLDSQVPDFPLYTMGVNSYVDSFGGYIRTSIEQDQGSRRPFHVHNIHIGNYMSIATGINLCVGSNHNYRAISNSGIASSPENLYPFVNKGQILIQNDVWIGCGATIMGGVTVHNGAVVAANSHVVKDVPPYAIVGGNPARIIKYRFSEEIIKKLQLIRWWNWSAEKIQANKIFFNSYNIKNFCEKFYPAALKEKQSVKPPKYKDAFKDKKIYVYFLDLKSRFPLWQRTVQVFKDLHIGGGGYC